MSNCLDFVKGHCGFDIVTLVIGHQINRGDEIQTAKKIIDSPVNGGIEVGLLYKEDKRWRTYNEKPFKADNFVRLKIIDSTHYDWLPMCGGMSQVIGKALIETSFKEFFDINTDCNELTIALVTDSGLVPLYIKLEDGVVTHVTTDMSEYVNFLYQTGVKPIVVNNVRAMKVGYFLIFDISILSRKYPGVDFTVHSPNGDHTKILHDLHVSYMKEHGISDGLYSMLYDFNPDGSGHTRLFSRFYDSSGVTSSIPWEFQCGTGTVAAGVAMKELNQLPITQPGGTLVCEWGNQSNTKDPYGIRTSNLHFGIEGNFINSASFSHSVVEVLAEGRLKLPNY